MPELPEVEVVRRGLASLLVGRSVAGVRCLRPALRYPLPANLQDRLCGRTCRDVQRRAKYLLLFFDGDLLLAWHMGMSGQFHVLPEDEKAGPHEHVRISLADGTSLRYRDARRFGYLELFPYRTGSGMSGLPALVPSRWMMPLMVPGCATAVPLAACRSRR